MPGPAPWYSGTVRDDVVTVGEFNFRHEVEQARDFLQDHGIEGIIWSDDAGGLYPPVGFLERYLLKVLAAQEQDARRLLEEVGLGR